MSQILTRGPLDDRSMGLRILILNIALIFLFASPSSSAAKKGEVAKPSKPTPSATKSAEAGDDNGDSKGSRGADSTCSQTFLLQGPVRGMLYKRCALPCDEKLEKQRLDCRKLERSKQDSVREYNRRIGSDSTTYSESHLREKQNIQEMKAQLDDLDQKMESQGCRNSDGSFNSGSIEECFKLLADRNKLVLTMNPIFEEYNARVKDLNSILHPRTLQLSQEISKMDSSLESCRTQAKSLEESCKKESDQGIRSIEIHQGYDKPERGTPDRSFEFELGPNPDKTIRDSHLLVMDAPSEKTSDSQFSLMMFFPRVQKPSVEVEQDQSILATLSNGERIRFSPEKHIPSEGVLVQTRAVERGNIIRPGFNYNGGGFMLRADWRADGFVGKKKISLQGRGKDCDLTPHANLIWTNEREFRFETDKQWDAFIQKRCGFSIF